MSNAFYITFWVSIIILLIINVIYSFFAYDSLGAFENLTEVARLVQARDYVLWALILYGIALGLIVIYMIGAFAFGWGKTYQRPGFVFILHTFLFLWILAAVILMVLATERLDGSSTTLSSTDLQIAVRDIGVTLISGSAILILLAVAYFGHVYRTERRRYYCKQNYALKQLQMS